MTDRQIIWVSKDLVRKLQLLEECDIITTEEITKIIKDLKDEISLMDDALDQNVLSFRAHAQKVRDLYKMVVDEEISKTYDLWNEMDIKRCEVQTKLEDIRRITKTVKDDLMACKTELSTLNVYGADRVVELLTKFQSLSSDDKDLLTDLCNLRRNKQ